LGRFFAVDPLAPDYPWNSPYAFSENVLINAVELEGLEKVYVYNVIVSKNKDGKMVKSKPKLSHKFTRSSLGLYNSRVYHYYDTEGNLINKVEQMVSPSDRNPNKSSERAWLDAAWNAGQYGYYFEMWATFKEKALDPDHNPDYGWEAVGQILTAWSFIASSGSAIVFFRGAQGTAISGKLLYEGSKKVIGLALSVDELTKVAGETALSGFFEKHAGEKGKEMFEGAKVLISLKAGSMSAMNVSFTLLSGETVEATYDIISGILNVAGAAMTVQEEQKKENEGE
jgi:hypothetical protein